MFLSFKKTSIFSAVKWSQSPLFLLAKPAAIILLSLSLALFLLFAFFAINSKAQDQILDKILGGCFVCFSLGFLALETTLFFKTAIQNPKLEYSLHDLIIRPEYLNLAGFLDLEAAKICLNALKKAKKLKIGEVSGKILFESILKSNSQEIKFILNRAGLDVKSLKGNISQKDRGLEKSEIKKIIFEAGKISQEKSKQKIGPGDIFVSLARYDELTKSILNDYDLKSQDIANLAQWYEKIHDRGEQNKKFWLLENLKKRGAFGRDFAAGFSITLDRFSDDLQKRIIKFGSKEIVGHKKEIQETENALSKKDRNSVLLVGEPGVGRKSVVFAIAEKAFTGESSKNLNFSRVVEFNPSLVATISESLDVAETLLEKCFFEAWTAGNIILVIDNFHDFVSHETQPGKLNISAVLSRYLQLTNFRLIAITSYDGLHQIIEKNSSLLNQFDKIEVSEISQNETLIFLENLVPYFEQKHKKFIPYKCLREIIALSNRYMPQTPFPDKAVRILDESMAIISAEKSNGRILTPANIKKLISQKTEIPVEDLEEKEKSKLLNLEKIISQKIIGQEEAISQVSNALRRARTDIQLRQGPMGSFLFLGPTGVGKTETAKVLTEIYFGSAKKMVRLDMTEFQNPGDINRLLGTADEIGLLTAPVKESPFCLLLLDEIEKAHPNILNLFLQILDEGSITDGLGKKINFQNVMIIATSNAGAEIIRQDIAKDESLDIIKDRLLDEIFKQGIFRSEFINRFDGVVIFKPLEKQHLLQIAYLMMKKLADNLEDKGIKLEISETLQEKIVDISYNPVFGAREMRRIIQNKIENILAEALLTGRIKRGDSITINPENFQIIKTK